MTAQNYKYSFRKKVYEEKNSILFYFYLIAMYWLHSMKPFIRMVRCQVRIWTNGEFYLSSSLLHDSVSYFLFRIGKKKMGIAKERLILSSLLGGTSGWLSSFVNTHIHDLSGSFFPDSILTP